MKQYNYYNCVQNIHIENGYFEVRIVCKWLLVKRNYNWLLKKWPTLVLNTPTKVDMP